MERRSTMPFVIATEMKSEVIQGGSPNPAGKAVVWFFVGMGKWTRDIGRAQRYDDEGAATAMVVLKDGLPNQKFVFILVDQLPISAEAASLDPAELERLRKVAKEFRESIASGYEYGQPPPLHEPRLYKVGDRQCLCKACVRRVLDLFPGEP